MRKKICFAMVAGILLAGCDLASAENELSYLINPNGAVKVYIKEVTNASGNDTISADAFRKELETSLANRKSVRFEVVGTPEGSTVQVSCTITHYKYAETDPVKPTVSAAGMLLDAVTTENYAEMKADFTVVDTKNGKVVWQDTIEDFIKETMTPAESLPLIYDKVCRKFLWKSFGKGK